LRWLKANILGNLQLSPCSVRSDSLEKIAGTKAISCSLEKLPNGIRRGGFHFSTTIVIFGLHYGESTGVGSPAEVFSRYFLNSMDAITGH